MKRRETIAAIGAVGLAGCLGPLAGHESTPDTSSTETGESDDRQSIYSARADAIARAGSFADDVAPSFGTYEGNGPDTIAFPDNRSGTSATTGDRDSVVSADQVAVAPLGDERIRFGGETGRSLRVRNLATESTLTFEPDPDTDVYSANGIEFDIDGEGNLNDAAPSLTVPDREETTVSPSGTWSGDHDLFKRQTFATYVIELLEDATVVGTTGGRVIGIGYQWDLAQTESTAFVTRHPSVREDWHAELRLGDRPFDYVDSVTAAHRPDSDVFEVDLTELDVDPGEYNWRLHLSESEGDNRHDRFIEFSSTFGHTVVVE